MNANKFKCVSLYHGGLQGLIAICPWDVLFRPTRWWLLKHLCFVVGSPFTPVAFEDSFLADYLTSMVKVWTLRISSSVLLLIKSR